MVNGIDNNIFLVNAPAGSGKTTWIRKEVEKHLLENENDNILCITYTNRAADELGRDLDSERVFIGTIHSFISNYIGSFFEHKTIVDFYWELYKDRIHERINNEKYKESNLRYAEKYGNLDMDTVYSNLTRISYGETPYTSLYYGALSHDDLLSFTRKVVEKYPIIQKKISDKYQLVFIDEYQDTSTDVLNLFYSSMKNSKGMLYLLGDKMQRIYKTYDGGFEENFKTLNTSKRLDTNYRSTPFIVSILNAIYNDESLAQHSYEKNSDNQMLFKPCVIFTDNKKQVIDDFVREYKNALVLYLTNAERFYKIGAGNLYGFYDSMDKYSHGAKYSAKDVLTNEDVWCEDILLNVTYLLVDICNCYKEKKYGDIFKLARKNKKTLNDPCFTIKVHKNKKELHDKLEEILDVFLDTETTIGYFLQQCSIKGFIPDEYYGKLMEEESYRDALNIKLLEAISVKQYLDKPNISTQHGVKGESYETVLFVAENGSNSPYVYMNKFFEMWSKINVALSSFEEFYYSYLALINQIENSSSMKLTEISSAQYKCIEGTITEHIEHFIDSYRDNEYYIALLKDKFNAYLKKRNVTAFKACLKENNVYGVLSAYRLFYVGCSRARKNLAIVIQNSDVSDFKTDLVNKFQTVGFDVNDIGTFS
ncbi:MAG: ATP-dependent helicase [Lachnospiraceae bacterium]|nr:ATP-dependent helicase [Lachnospiraceae bacterium]